MQEFPFDSDELGQIADSIARPGKQVVIPAKRGSNRRSGALLPDVGDVEFVQTGYTERRTRGSEPIDTRLVQVTSPDED